MIIIYHDTYKLLKYYYYIVKINFPNNTQTFTMCVLILFYIYIYIKKQISEMDIFTFRICVGILAQLWCNSNPSFYNTLLFFAGNLIRNLILSDITLNYNLAFLQSLPFFLFIYYRFFILTNSSDSSATSLIQNINDINPIITF